MQSLAFTPQAGNGCKTEAHQRTELKKSNGHIALGRKAESGEETAFSFAGFLRQIGIAGCSL
ncbi:MAG: hypothetical protein EPO08_11455 [Rhodospirillaceae bacterium]|nr:MAG: hypothetical protein EPO08_11455 [Rhodospirillaceae bacterium]